MEKMNVFVTAKAYPVESASYEEVVCTAGITDKGNLIRIYPVPFRRLRKDLRFEKYQWITIEVEKREANKDCRKESYRCNIDSIRIGEKINSENCWEKRKEIFIKQIPIYYNYEELYSASDKTKKDFISLAIFKPSQVIGIEYEKKPTSKDKPSKFKQLEFDLANEVLPYNPKPAREMPYYVRYKFIDSQGKAYKSLIEDWEAYSLFWRYKDKGKSAEEAIQIVQDKYESLIEGNDIYFFMGTRFRDHIIYNNKNYFSIISVFKHKKQEQLYLF